MTASSRTVQSCTEGGSDCPGCSRHWSSSDFVSCQMKLATKVWKWWSEGLYLVCKELCQVTILVLHSDVQLPKSVTLFWSTLVFFPCFDVAVCWEFVKSAREFFLIGSCAHQVHSCHSPGTVSCLYRLGCTLWLPLIRLRNCNCRELLVPGSHPRTDCPFVWWFQRG